MRKKQRLTLFLILILSAGTLTASARRPAREQVRRVVDLAPGPAVSGPFTGANLVTFQGNLFFRSRTTWTGAELFRSDLTPEGTRVVADICPGRCSGDARWPTVVGDRLFFESCGEARGCQLWTAPGTTVRGAQRLTTFPFTMPNRYRRSVVAWGEQAVYARANGEVWLSDGTLNGTTLLTDRLSSGPQVAVAGPNLFLLWGVELWWSDGVRVERLATEGGSRGAAFDEPLPVGDLLFFAERSDSSALWVSDGTAAGTRRIWQKPAGNETDLAHLQFTDGGRAFFSFHQLADGVWQRYFWQSDGSPEGTRPVFFGMPAVPIVDVDWAAAIYDGRLYFATIKSPYTLLSIGVGADDVVSVGQLPGRVRQMVASGPYLYLVAEDPSSRGVLYRSSGTPETTIPLRSFLGPALEMTATDQGVALSLYGSLVTSDGTVAGTRALERPPTPPSGDPRRLVEHRGKLLFNAFPPLQTGITDGTAAGTQIVSDRYLQPISAAGRAFFFETNPWQLGLSVLEDDGSLVQLLDDTLLIVAYPWGAREYNGFLYFVALSRGNPLQLWRSDGTRDGTRFVGDLRDLPFCPIEDCGFVLETETFGGDLFLVVHDTLWRSTGTIDGTGITAGTRLVARAQDLCPDCEYSFITNLRTVGDRLFIFVLAPGGYQLWVFDDTAGLTFVTSVEGSIYSPVSVVAGDQLVFTLRQQRTSELWVSDGTAAGTRRLRTIQLGPYPLKGYELQAFGGRVFFSADDGVHGQELWVTDGTEAGTRLHADLRQGPEPSIPQQLTVAGDRLFFAAADGVHGLEPWVMGPDDFVPRRLGDLFPGPGSSSPREFTPAGGRVFFNAGDPDAGFELWAEGLGAQVFADGFESGDLSSWSSADP